MRIPWYVLVLAACCGSAFGQWLPVSSSQTVTVQVVASGGRVTSQQEHQERHFRRSDGSSLVQQMATDGSNQPVSGVLLDRSKTGRSYAVNYQTGKAADQHQPAGAEKPKTREDLESLKPKRPLHEDTINGIACVVAPVSLVNRDGSKTVIGRVWLVPEYNYMVIKEDTMHPLKDGTHLHIVRETNTVVAGVEPDGTLFATDSASVKQAKSIPLPKRNGK